MSIKYDENELPYIDLGCNYKIRLEYEEIQEEKYIEKAKNELRETKEIKQSALVEMKKLLKGKF